MECYSFEFGGGGSKCELIMVRYRKGPVLKQIFFARKATLIIVYKIASEYERRFVCPLLLTCSHI